MPSRPVARPYAISGKLTESLAIFSIHLMSMGAKMSLAEHLIVAEPS